ncbi:MAG: VOC family protein [Maricaulaceae bacterium]|jgi:lactoylglutathione lyase
MSLKRLIVAVGAAACLSTLASAAEPGEESEAPALRSEYMTAVGIGVSDLEASTTFYENALGMTQLTTYELDYMNEVVLGFPGGEAVVVLMHYIDGREVDYEANPVKLVFRVPDPVAFAEQIRAAGGVIEREPVAAESVGGAVVGFARDPDGYQIEILQAGPAE